MTTPINLLLPRLERVRRLPSGQYMASCPGPLHVHGDRNPSLSIAEFDNGILGLKCFAGCEAAAIVAAVGLALADLFPDRPDWSQGHSRRPRQPSPPWRELLRMICLELEVIEQARMMRQRGESLSPEDRERVAFALRQIKWIKEEARAYF